MRINIYYTVINYIIVIEKLNWDKEKSVMFTLLRKRFFFLYSSATSAANIG